VRDLLVLAAIGAAITLLFANGALDLATARLFYTPGEDHWPFGGEMPWSLLYKMAPWITASLVLGAMGALLVGFVRKRDEWRRDATFVLLALVLGPGLLVNGVLKDHWNRPRPRDLVEFGGPWHYAAAPLRGEGGKSFPCGHCSVGFLYGVGWWIWARCGGRPFRLRRRLVRLHRAGICACAALPSDIHPDPCPGAAAPRRRRRSLHPARTIRHAARHRGA